MVSNLLLFMFMTGSLSSGGIPKELIDSVKERLITEQMQDQKIKEEILCIFQEADRLVQRGNSSFDKFINGSYEQDRLTLKDFIWSFKSIDDGIQRQIIRPLDCLRKTVKSEALAKAVAIVQVVAVELHTGISQLVKALHPYERTKERSNAYRVAKLLKTNVEKFLTKDRIDKYKNDLEVVISLLGSKSSSSEFGDLVEDLLKLHGAISKMGDSTAKVDELKILNRIINRISHN